MKKTFLTAVVAMMVLGSQTWAQTFWEDPAVLQAQGVRYSQSSAGGGLLAVAWQESSVGASGQTISLSLAVSRDGESWTRHLRIIGPIPYSEPDPSLHPMVFSMVVDAQERILMAVADRDKSVVILVSVDGGRSFTETARIESNVSVVTPALVLSAKGDYLLFVTGAAAQPGGAQGYLSIFSSTSADGAAWTAFSPFITREELRYNLSPRHAVSNGRDYVVFQSRSGQDTYQLYLMTSTDGGRTWDSPRDVTLLPAFNTVEIGKQRQAVEITNQRASIAPVAEGLGIVWERNLPGARPQLSYCVISDDGSVVVGPEKVSTATQSIMGQIVRYKDGLYVLFTDTEVSRTRVSLAARGGIWRADILGGDSAGSTPGNPQAIVFADKLLVFWEASTPAGSSLVELRPVTHVDSPVLAAVGFTPGRRTARSAVEVRWADPRDPAGIRSYSYTWGPTGSAEVSRSFSQSNPTVALAADKDGEWTLTVTAEDRAGNVSKPATITFWRDTTPPGPPSILPPSLDDSGFLLSNTFTVSWTPPEGDETARYLFGIRNIGDEVRDIDLSSFTGGAVSLETATEAPRASYNDQDDGTWVFAVAAVDTAGNVGKPAAALLRLNKFIPYTTVYRVRETSDEFGNVTLAIEGRGFTANGAIDAVTLTGKGGSAYEFSRRKGDFAVLNDRLITGPRLTSEMKSDAYTLALAHPQRGLFVWRGGLITFDAPGTLKIGDFRLRYLPAWVTLRVPLYAVSTTQLLVVVFIAFIGTMIVLSARRMAALVREGAMVREEVTALIEGRPSAALEERKKKMRELQRKGAGLRLKYTLLMIVLVILIVLIVSVPLSIQMVGRQRTILADNLNQRAQILIGSLAQAAENQFRFDQVEAADVALIPNSISSMKDALWATVTGPGGTKETQADKDYVWASNDPAWMQDHPAYRAATAKPADEISAQIGSIADAIEADARQKIQPMYTESDKFYDRYLELSLKLDARSQQEADAAFTAYVNGNAANSAAVKADPSLSWVKSVPEFNPDLLKPVYVFYKPIVFTKKIKDANGDLMKNADGTFAYTPYYQGMVRLGVSTTLITQQINDARESLIRITGLIALAAVALGVLGAIVLASITVTPIKKLAKGVAIIRDTEDKEELSHHSIEVHTKDEIGMLADTVNDMTKGLVKAAIANKELMVGKDVQKMFLPLEKDTENKKGATGGEDNPLVEIYGYYEGAKGVSGDYFDFKKLDETHYAIIKCDVAGKGVPAALIMVEVATLFISYFRDWVKRREELARMKDPMEKKKHQRELEKVDTLVYTINDMIEERGFKGRFAQLTVCLFDTKTGIARICHAGDKLSHVYKAGLHSMTHTELNDVPAAGVFPSVLLEMKSGFKQVEKTLERGDALFLFTDGFEESKRTFRDGSFQVVPCSEPGLKDGEIHLDTHAKGSTTEEFGIPRIDGVINAVFNRQRYTLVRHHNPIPNEELIFDFSSCQGTVKEAVLALVAVEKIFRLSLDPAADGAHRVSVDQKVNAFLKEHFLQYPVYFAHPLNGNGHQEGAAAVFTHLREEDQYDDLTLLVLRKK